VSPAGHDRGASPESRWHATSVRAVAIITAASIRLGVRRFGMRIGIRK
jgi:hypothetical protein